MSERMEVTMYSANRWLQRPELPENARQEGHRLTVYLATLAAANPRG